MNNEKNKVFAAAMFALFAIVMITSNYNYAMAKKAESGDNGGDNQKQKEEKQSNDNNDNQESKASSNPKDTSSNDDSAGSNSNSNDEPKTTIGDTISRGERHIKKTPDFNFEKPVKDEPKTNIKVTRIDDGVEQPHKGKVRPSTIEKDNQGQEPEQKQEKTWKGTAPDEVCDVSHDCFGPGHTEKGDKNCHGYYCAGDNKGDTNKGKGKGDGGSYDGGHDGHDDHNDDHKHHSHGSHNHNHNHGHNYDNDKHYHNHDDNNYYYYYSNDYNDNHATVILQLDYHGSSNHDNIRLEIGNDFDTTINFAGEPEEFSSDGFGSDDGEIFSIVKI